jgi:hypothetical protein
LVLEHLLNGKGVEECIILLDVSSVALEEGWRGLGAAEFDRTECCPCVLSASKNVKKGGLRKERKNEVAISDRKDSSLGEGRDYLGWAGRGVGRGRKQSEPYEPFHFLTVPLVLSFVQESRYR